MNLGPTSEALEYAREGKHEQAVALVTRILASHPDCPYLLVLRALTIQMQQSTDGPTLADAEDSLLRALDVDKTYLPALEELAHFYDSVTSDRIRARVFATRYLEIVLPIVKDMQKIADDR